VGVVRDLRIKRLDQDAPPVVYLPYTHMFGTLNVQVRTQSNPATFASTLQGRVKALNLGIRLSGFESLQEATEKTIQDRLRAGVLVGGFALLGLLIGSVGLYGTLSSQVRERRREIGIRLALGATTRSTTLRVLGEGARLVASGAAVGLAGSAVAARLVQKELFGVGPMDATSFALALTLLLATALLACLVPALRAARTQPVETLRSE
jgi:ABC-type antimicrobial peptide transport system permease subunit